MEYTFVSGDSHMDFTWLPGDLFMEKRSGTPKRFDAQGSSGPHKRSIARHL